jgi:hypothetical protein
MYDIKNNSYLFSIHNYIRYNIWHFITINYYEFIIKNLNIKNNDYIIIIIIIMTIKCQLLTLFIVLYLIS